MNVSVSHPTDRPNFALVEIGPIELAFSYETVIGYRLDGIGPWVTRPNHWGPTTGKHLAFLGRNPGKVETETAEGFLGALQGHLETLGAIGEGR